MILTKEQIAQLEEASKPLMKLPAALSPNEQKWFDIFEDGCKRFDRRYVVTWWLRNELKISTQKINYHLSKLSSKGMLKKETDEYCTKFYYATDFL